MNVEHRTSNVEHRIMHSAIYNKDKATCRVEARGEAWSAFHIRRSTLNVRCSMFKLLHLKLRLNLHITLKLRIQVRSSEITTKKLTRKRNKTVKKRKTNAAGQMLDPVLRPMLAQ